MTDTGREDAGFGSLFMETVFGGNSADPVNSIPKTSQVPGMYIHVHTYNGRI